MSEADPLDVYRNKRDFSRTPEPAGSPLRKPNQKGKPLHFMIQKHDATRLHFDFRLEVNGVLKSWAVTRGPSLDPAEKRLAVRTEDHPMEYARFEGIIPDGYGAGTVLLWDRGDWLPEGDPVRDLERGALSFELKGQRLKGAWSLVRMKSRSGKRRKSTRENWLLIKKDDTFAAPETDPVEIWTESIVSGRDLSQIEQGVPAPKKKQASKRAPFPGFIPPQLATPTDQPPTGADWMHELKLDGYRIQAHLTDGKTRLLTRNEKDWTGRYPAIAAAIAGLAADDAILDGELVALTEDGRTSFAELQAVQERRSDAQLVYFAFDLLHLNGRSLQSEPLVRRKEQLKALLAGEGHTLRFADHILGNGPKIVANACQLGVEGIVSKKASGRHRSGRSSAWLKSKCIGREEFVIGGYRRSSRKGRPFSSLLLGEFRKGQLEYRGRVGSGFSDDTLAALAGKLEALRQDQSAFRRLPASARQDAVWVEPVLVAQIAYAERTPAGQLRHPVFQGLREDKPAMDVKAADAGRRKSGAQNPADRATVGGVKISHPDRPVLVSATKLDVAQYVSDLAPHILPFLAGRPVSLVRCPQGAGGKCFFQKHTSASTPEAYDSIRLKQSVGTHADYIQLNTATALVSAAQSGVLEFHPWGARSDRLERPDRLVIDLDPDETLPFTAVRDAAGEIRDVLESAGLVSFPLLTGGKGIHVIAPLSRRQDWPAVKAAAQGLAQRLAQARPDLYVATMSKQARKGRIFIDWLRNERGATAICPYSLRARTGGPVATPVSWQELSRANAADIYTISNIRARLAKLTSDPWEGYHEIRQAIAQPVLKLLAPNG